MTHSIIEEAVTLYTQDKGFDEEGFKEHMYNLFLPKVA